MSSGDGGRRDREVADGAEATPLLVPAILMTIGDVILTMTWLDRGAAEANPLIARMIDWLGVHAALGLRGLIGIALLLALAWLARRNSFADAALFAVTAVLGGLLIWHIGGGLRFMA